MTSKAPERLTLALTKRLSDEATAAAEQAYAPYSHFRVGAAVLGASGRVFRGANVENASYGLATCAERVALANARVAGETSISAVAIACVYAAADAALDAKMPCGACRQWLQELAPAATIVIVGEKRSFAVADLLPHPFDLER